MVPKKIEQGESNSLFLICVKFITKTLYYATTITYNEQKTWRGYNM